MAGELQSSNNILLKANVPYGHVKVVFSWSSRPTLIWLYPNRHLGSNSENVPQIDLTSDLGKRADSKTQNYTLVVYYSLGYNKSKICIFQKLSVKWEKC